MTKAYRLAGAVAAPLIIAGCGMPIGVQIASLLADSVSVIATDKTITDHGLSAVTEKDCALWRGVKGKDICQNKDDAVTTIADASDLPEPKPAETEVASIEIPKRDWGATAAAEQKTKNTARRETPEFPTEDPAPAAAAPSPVVAAPTEVMPPKTELKAWSPVTTVQTLPATPVIAAVVPAAPEPVVVRQAPTAAKPAYVPKTYVAKSSVARQPAAKTRTYKARTYKAPSRKSTTKTRKTYFVIASYHRRAAAKRYSVKHARLEPTILEGTARGKRVYRVAIGPVARAGRKTTRQFLEKRGFGDAWALTVKTAKPTTEVAALR